MTLDLPSDYTLDYNGCQVDRRREETSLVRQGYEHAVNTDGKEKWNLTKGMKAIVALEVVDKRETDQESTVMEKEGFKRAITSLLDQGVNITEPERSCKAKFQNVYFVKRKNIVANAMPQVVLRAVMAAVLLKEDRNGAPVVTAIVEPAKRDKKAKPNGEYFVQFNDGSVTVHLPAGSAKQWIDAIEAYYDGQKVPMEGDGLSCMRGVESQDARADGNTPVDRLEGLELVTAEWHAQVTSLQDVYDDYYNPKSAKEKGTLNHARNRYIAEHNALLTPRLSAAILHNKTINFHGLPGKNIPKDLFMEFLNRKAKDGLTRLGPNMTSATVTREGNSLGVLDDILSSFDRDISLYTAISLQKDLRVRKDRIQAEGVFIANPRIQKTFCADREGTVEHSRLVESLHDFHLTSQEVGKYVKMAFPYVKVKHGTRPGGKRGTLYSGISIRQVPQSSPQSAMFGSPPGTTMYPQQSTSQSAVFGSPPGTTMYPQQSTPQSAVFGSPPGTTMYPQQFTSQSAVFGSPPGTTMYPQQSTSQSAVFGSPPGTTMYPQQSTSQSAVFGSPPGTTMYPQQSTSQSAVFGSPPGTTMYPQQSTSQSAVFGSPPGTTMYPQQSTSQSAVFGSPQGTTMYPQQSTSQSAVFGSPPGTTMYPQQSTSQSAVFGSPQGTTMYPQQSTSQSAVFGSPPTTPHHLINRYKQELEKARALNASLTQQLHAAQTLRAFEVTQTIRQEMKQITAKNTPISKSVQTVEDIRSFAVQATSEYLQQAAPTIHGIISSLLTPSYNRAVDRSESVATVMMSAIANLNSQRTNGLQTIIGLMLVATTSNDLVHALLYLC
ncbi:Hypp6536 [Branchiostoma lanceolatum]|uniref:Hypp6536 protein n=1 Tax=Branchiostoma lanceolatum TaxID=7740 RepID=A0A8J9YV41_BRALA|nr:Hypp6536 [Branchiostoma lanceolatum]